MNRAPLRLLVLLLLLAGAGTTQRVTKGRNRVELVHNLAGTVVSVMGLTSAGGGSGVIIDEWGTVLTNYHVVARTLAERDSPKPGCMKCGTRDGRLRLARIIGLDPGGDLALLRLERRPDEKEGPFPWAPVGSQDDLEVGAFVLAMGNPFLLATDFTPTVTLGVVSGLHRYLPGRAGKLVYPDCIQTDASVNPGNSGGPLFDMEGRIVGINGRVSVGRRGRVNVGLGFAIGADQIRLFLPDLRAGRVTAHGSLRIDAREVEDDLIIAAIEENGPAWNAGMRTGDYLEALDGVPLRNQNDLLQRIAVLPAGWPVTVTWRQGRGRATTSRLTLIPATMPDKKLVDWEPEGLEAVLAFEKQRLQGMIRRALGRQGRPGRVTLTRRTPVNAPDSITPPPGLHPARGALNLPLPEGAEFDGGTRLAGWCAAVILLPGTLGQRLLVDPESGLPLATGWRPGPDRAEIRLIIREWHRTPAGLLPKRVDWVREGRVLLREEFTPTRGGSL